MQATNGVSASECVRACVRGYNNNNREGAFLFRRVSVLVQRFNAVLLHDSLPTPDCTD